MRIKINYHCRNNTNEEFEQFMDRWIGTDGLEWQCPRNWTTVLLKGNAIMYWI